MSGIRLINAPPETFRFPEWRDDIFYAPDSMVRYASYMAPTDSDSDSLKSRFYIALKPVNPGTGIPPLRADMWARIAENAQSLATVVSQIIDNDSDIAWLRTAIPHIQLERDSDVGVVVADHDSHKSMTYHDFSAADSDITVRIDSELHDLNAFDSDILISLDSDFKAAYHDFSAADSDITVRIDSEFHDLNAFDSDVNAALTQISWDYGANYF